MGGFWCWRFGIRGFGTIRVRMLVDLLVRTFLDRFHGFGLDFWGFETVKFQTPNPRRHPLSQAQITRMPVVLPSTVAHAGCAFTGNRSIKLPQ